MGIHAHWADSARTLLVMTFETDWSWEDYRAAHVMAWDALAEFSHPVDMIYDFSSSDTIPTRALAEFGRALRAGRPDNVDRIVLVGTTGLLRIINGVLRNTYPAEAAGMMDAHTLAQAYQMLERGAEV